MENQHHNHHEHYKDNTLEYFKFAAVLIFITIASLFIWIFSYLMFLDVFMGVFFLVFAGFKLRNLKEFAMGFQSYDIIASRSLAYSYAYPFIQLFFAVAYLGGFGSWIIDLLVIIVSLISSIGVLRTLGNGAKVHCVCLGNVIKLPLSRITLVEDFGMALMATVMLLIR